MPFQDKDLWMTKDSGDVTERDAMFDKSSGLDPKRSHRWFVDTAEPQLTSRKKQALQHPDSKSTSEFPAISISPWENSPGCQSFQNQFIDRLFGPEMSRSVSFAERNISPDAGDDTSMRRKGLGEEYGEDASVSLSISPAMEDSQSCLSYNGVKKVEVNRVKDNDNSMHALKGHSTNRESISRIALGQAYVAEDASSFITMGHVYDKEIIGVMDQTYNKGDDHVRMVGPTFDKGDDISVSIGGTYGKGDTTVISFSSFADDHDIVPVGRSLDNYDQSYNQSIQTLEIPGGNLDVSDAIAAATSSCVAKSIPESVYKNKLESKSSRKEAPNSFPSNVRSLICTGMLDGVRVKYVSLPHEELPGIIRGSGYLCGCQACNYSNVLNAYEFERHANCRTKHPNNHIYFDNGKTIYQIVQELRSTPESLLFDAIQNAFGSPINQKAFRIWKESFQAATRELQRIYGKEELNL